MGTGPAPYLTTKCLQKLATLEMEDFPVASPVAIRDFYVDDLITGANTITEALEIRNQMINLLSRGGFELRQWASNNKSLLNEIPNGDQPNMIIDFENDNNVKILGIRWDPIRDIFCFNIKQFKQFRQTVQTNYSFTIKQSIRSIRTYFTYNY